MIFKYKGKKQTGKIIIGLVEANSEKQAVSLLRSQGYYIISLQPKGTSSLAGLSTVMKHVSFTDIVHFTRQLSTMITAGLSITDSLNVLVKQSSNSAFTKVISEILKQIQGGSSFAKALEIYPQHFSQIYFALVRSGEASGKLPEVLERLSINLEKQREFNQKVKGALIYPTIIIVGMFAVMFLMMTLVVPKLTEIYKSFNAKLPWNTVLLIKISDVFAYFWWLIIIIIIGAFFAFRAWKKTSLGEKVVDRLVFMTPIIGNLYKQIVLTEFTRTLGILIGAGLPIIESLGIVSSSMESRTYRDHLTIITKQVEKGLPLGVPISQNPDFPPILGQMIIVGEETGKMDDTLMKLSNFFEIEAEYGVKNLTTAMEPLIMVILGVGVGFIIISVLLPIYNLTQSL